MTGLRKLRLMLPTPPARSSSHPTEATSIARQMAPVPIDQAIAQLARDDPAAAEDVGALYDALTWGEGAETITQQGLQGLLWYELPRKFMGGPSKLDMALALGHLLGRAPWRSRRCASERPRLFEESKPSGGIGHITDWTWLIAGPGLPSKSRTSQAPFDRTAVSTPSTAHNLSATRAAPSASAGIARAAPGVATSLGGPSSGP
jgi:hypothetical protein